MIISNVYYRRFTAIKLSKEPVIAMCCAPKQPQQQFNALLHVIHGSYSILSRRTGALQIGALKNEELAVEIEGA
jgi:hypothetical protein